jgi:2-dehydro-3-deoxyphosphogluconate aldolase/(4S)-4-hydroxy-2-oxoglutarate aldolase
MNEIIKTIGDYGIVPVIKIENAADAAPLGKALVAGGLPVAEITFRTEAAEQAIINIAAEVPEILLGAGTILSVEQVKRALGAGAKFIVTPGFNPKVVEYCAKNNVAITPGCSNPTDIEMALEFGLEVVKFFPAEALGGINAIKAIGAPYSMIKFVPTGGVSEKNLNDYLSLGNVLACGGSWMVKDELIKAGKFDEITKLTKDALGIMLGFDLAHLGINSVDADTSLNVTKQFGEVFNFPLNEGNSSNFAGTCIEVNKSIGLGKNGHIAIKTNNIIRANAFLKRRGVEIDIDSAKKSPTGQMVAVYLKHEIGGFAIHLLQKK